MRDPYGSADRTLVQEPITAEECLDCLENRYGFYAVEAAMSSTWYGMELVSHTRPGQLFM